MDSVTVGITGASGAVIALRLIEELVCAGVSVNVVYTKAAQIVFLQELNFRLSTPRQTLENLKNHLKDLHPLKKILGLKVYGFEDWNAPIASGSGISDSMIVCPCSMGTLASIANGMSSNLLERAADVTIKEGKILILVPRETPLSTIHLQNMLSLSKIGVRIFPPCPGFYTRPKSVGEVVDFFVGRILDLLDISNDLYLRWRI